MALKIGTTEPTEIKAIKNSTTTDLTVYKYATTGTDLGEATRSSVSSYTSTQLNSWVGLQNDTWGAITNASSLVADKYYYIRVLVSDTNKYGKFCVRFKSYSGQTITVENMGWGYDGEVIYSTPVWGKPYSFIANGSNCTITASRTSSPNEHASIGDSLTTGSKIYYGDVIQIAVLPTTSQYQLTSVKINDVEQTLTSGTFETTLTVTGSININAVAGMASKTWQTKFSGSKSTTFSYTLENNPMTQEFPTSDWDYTNIPLSNYNVTLSATENPIRITGTLKVTTKSGSTSNSATTTLTANELTTSWERKTNNVSITVKVGSNNYAANSSAWLRAETSNLGLRIDVNKARNLTTATGTAVLTVTKVEQYLIGGTATKLSKPIIDYVSRTSGYELEFRLQNTNDVAVTANIKLTDAYDTVDGANTATVAANSYQQSSVSLSSSGDYEAGWKLEVYYTASGYNQSDTTTYIGEAM